MADRVLPGPVENGSFTPEPADNVNIHISKIFDSCKDKDCVEDLRVYTTVSSQALIDSAFSVRPGSAELLCAKVSVEEISFNRGYYTVDITYFYKVTGNTFPGNNEICGLAVFDKRVILFGSDGGVKVFSSEDYGCADRCRKKPVAYVEAVDPIALNMKILDPGCLSATDAEARPIPDSILERIGEDLVLGGNGRRLYVTLGQFSVIRLERDTQLTLDNVRYFFPCKECIGSSDDDPCTLFSKVRFPVEEFLAPDDFPQENDYKNLI